MGSVEKEEDMFQRMLKVTLVAALSVPVFPLAASAQTDNAASQMPAPQPTTTVVNGTGSATPSMGGSSQTTIPNTATTTGTSTGATTGAGSASTSGGSPSAAVGSTTTSTSAPIGNAGSPDGTKTAGNLRSELGTSAGGSSTDTGYATNEYGREGDEPSHRWIPIAVFSFCVVAAFVLTKISRPRES